MSLKSQIKEMAEKMNVTEADVKFFAGMMLNQMKSDKLDIEHLEVDGTIQAYAISAATSADKLVTEVLVNVPAREALMETVYEMAKNDIGNK